jgi:hypothetical protein
MKVLKMKFGKSGEGVDAFGIRFLGDIDRKLESLGSIGELLSDPDMPPTLKQKRVTLWFTLARLHPYKRVSDLLGALITILKEKGYTIVVSSIDGLADTTTPEYENRPEGRFPPSDRMHVYNASNGFSVTAENSDAASKFSMAEIESIQKEALRFSRIVYGRVLERI